jgi:hypothetical protein
MENNMNKTTWKRGEWTTEIPEEIGWFWFYGDALSSDITKRCRNELYTVEICKISDGYMYVTHGHFMENKFGFWKKLNAPKLPYKPFTKDIKW